MPPPWALRRLVGTDVQRTRRAIAARMPSTWIAAAARRRTATHPERRRDRPSAAVDHRAGQNDDERRHSGHENPAAHRQAPPSRARRQRSRCPLYRGRRAGQQLLPARSPFPTAPSACSRRGSFRIARRSARRKRHCSAFNRQYDPFGCSKIFLGLSTSMVSICSSVTPRLLSAGITSLVMCR